MQFILNTWIIFSLQVKMCYEFVLEFCTYLCFETSCRRRREKISLTDHVKVLRTVKEDRNALQTIKRKEANCIGHILLSKCFLNTLLKERRRKDMSNRKTRKKTSSATGWRKGKKRILEIKRGSTTSHTVEKWLWKRLWSGRKTDCRVNCALFKGHAVNNDWFNDKAYDHNVLLRALQLKSH